VGDDVGQKRHWPGVNEATCSGSLVDSIMSLSRSVASSGTLGGVDRVVMVAVVVVVVVVAPSMKLEGLIRLCKVVDKTVERVRC
jgi:hypothetical protein